MNADDRGMNLAEGLHARRASASSAGRPLHGGYPGVPVRVSSVRDPGLPNVDWESAAGRAFQEAHTARREVARLRQWLRDYSPLVLAEFDADKDLNEAWNTGLLP